MTDHRDPEIYDLKGLICPLPVLKARKKLAGMAPGSRLLVETTDPLAVVDIPHFCRESGHVLVSSTKRDNGHAFLIERA